MSEQTEHKTTVKIAVAGRPKSGKSTILSLIARFLESSGVEVEIKWGIDGEPRTHKQDDELLARKLAAVMAGTKVVIVEQQLPRQQTKPE